jgi:hypothetical protein
MYVLITSVDVVTSQRCVSQVNSNDMSLEVVRQYTSISYEKYVPDQTNRAAGQSKATSRRRQQKPEAVGVASTRPWPARTCGGAIGARGAATARQMWGAVLPVY